MKIRQPVINTMNKIGIAWEILLKSQSKVEVENRFGYGKCITTPLIAECIRQIYKISNDYESGIYKISLSDFDRLKYWVLEVDKNAYQTCID